MMLHLRAVDPDYLDIISDGPFIPKRLIAMKGTTPEHYIQKVKSEWTPEENNQVQKDAKVMNILHNALDSVLSNR